MRTNAALAVVLWVSACGPADVDGPKFGLANGTFDTEVFVPGSNPPNYGDAVIEIDIEGDTRTLAQGASVLAIDENGLPTLETDTAVYFALQAFQYTSDTHAEVFELRVQPEVWLDEQDVYVNSLEADAIFGDVTFDINGQQVAGTILLTAIRGDLYIERAGTDPADAVVGSFTNLEMISP